MSAQRIGYWLQGIVNRFKNKTINLGEATSSAYNLSPTTSRKGFTLIELMIAISIIAVLSTVGLISFNKAQQLGRDGRRKEDLQKIATALEIYRGDHGRYPCAGWVYSTQSSNWITDNVASGLNCSGTPGILDERYINGLPKDPINIGTSPSAGGNYIYGYRSYECKGTSYLLVAELENTSDPDRVGVKSPKWCDAGITYDVYGGGHDAVSSPNKFVITP